jgi:hypothetical protein
MIFPYSPRKTLLNESWMKSVGAAVLKIQLGLNHLASVQRQMYLLLRFCISEIKLLFNMSASKIEV